MSIYIFFQPVDLYIFPTCLYIYFSNLSICIYFSNCRYIFIFPTCRYIYFSNLSIYIFFQPVDIYFSSNIVLLRCFLCGKDITGKVRPVTMNMLNVFWNMCKTNIYIYFCVSLILLAGARIRFWPKKPDPGICNSNEGRFKKF